MHRLSRSVPTLASKLLQRPLPLPVRLAHSLRPERRGLFVLPCVRFASMSPGTPRDDDLTARETRSALNDQQPLTPGPSSVPTRPSSEEEVRAVRLEIEALKQKIALVEDKIARVEDKIAHAEADLDPSKHSTNINLSALNQQLAGLYTDLAELRKERNFLLASASQQEQPKGGLTAQSPEIIRVSAKIKDPSSFCSEYHPKNPDINYFEIFDTLQFDELHVANGEKITAIRLPQRMPNCKVAGRSLYVRSFYGDLLRQCLQHDTIILLGNPGVSKSVLQMVILAGLLAPPDAVPKESDNVLRVVRECLQGINVVIRQDETAADIFFLDERKHLYIPSIDKSIFLQFDLKRTLYLFEPGDTTNVSPFRRSKYDEVGKTLATLSPRESRYKEFAKQHSAITFYMPLYTKDQLVAIGLDMSRQADFPEKLRELYMKEAIRERFEEFGGVIRSVLVTEADKLDELREQQQQALDGLTPDRLHHLLTHVNNSEFMGINSISHKLILMDAAKSPEGKLNFRKSSPRLVSTPALEEKLLGLRLNIYDSVALLRNAEAWSDTKLCIMGRVIYQDVIAHWLTNGGINWEESPMENKNFQEFHLSLKKLTNDIKAVNKLKPGVLVYPRKENFAFTDMYFKDERRGANGKETIVCIQVWFGFSRNQKNLTLSSFKEFQKDVKCEGFNIKLVLVAPHSVADKAEFTPVVVEEKKEASQTVTDGAVSNPVIDEKKKEASQSVEDGTESNSVTSSSDEKEKKTVPSSSEKKKKNTVSSSSKKKENKTVTSPSDEKKENKTGPSSSEEKSDEKEKKWKKFEELGLQTKVVWKPPSSYNRTF